MEEESQTRLFYRGRHKAMKGSLKRVVAIVGIIPIMASMLTGCGLFKTVLGLSDNKQTTFTDVNDLESGKAYVLHDGKNV